MLVARIILVSCFDSLVPSGELFSKTTVSVTDFIERLIDQQWLPTSNNERRRCSDQSNYNASTIATTTTTTANTNETTNEQHARTSNKKQSRQNKHDEGNDKDEKNKSAGIAPQYKTRSNTRDITSDATTSSSINSMIPSSFFIDIFYY